MLAKFSVSNFKNFKEPIEFTLDQPGKFKYNSECISDGIVGKAILYGKNATGKSNLGKALLDIKKVLLGDKKASNTYPGEVFLNADNDVTFAEFTYVFKIDNNLIEYTYRKNSEQQLVSEKLSIDNNMIFDLDFIDPTPRRLGNLNQIGLNDLAVDRYFFNLDPNDEEKISFLRWVYNNSKNTDMVLLAKLMNFVEGMHYLNVNKFVENPSSFVQRSSERVSKENKEDLELFLNNMGFECKLLLNKEIDNSEKLYFDLKTPILFYENASSGIRAMSEFYVRLHRKLQNATFVYLDEFDAFFHYEMAESFFLHFKSSYPDIQFIFTSHNTDLISNRLSRPDCYFLISSRGKITSLDEATERELREGHNLEKMYRSGEFMEYE